MPLQRAREKIALCPPVIYPNKSVEDGSREVVRVAPRDPDGR